jgi:hypothetical protein
MIFSCVLMAIGMSFGLSATQTSADPVEPTAQSDSNPLADRPLYGNDCEFGHSCRSDGAGDCRCDPLGQTLNELSLLNVGSVTGTFQTAFGMSWPTR